MKNKYWLFPLGILVIWGCATASKTIENRNMTSVTFADMTKGRIEYAAAAEGILEADQTIRMRTPAELMIEDVFVHEGDYVEAGTPVASVYDKALLRETADSAEEETLTFLNDIRDNSYQIIAPADGYITEVCITEDSRMGADAILYKYASADCETYTAVFIIDELIAVQFSTGDEVKYTYTSSDPENTQVYTGSAEIEHIEGGTVTCSFKDSVEFRHGDTVAVTFRHTSETYDCIIPARVLSAQEDSVYTGRYVIYYAVPDADKENRYTVVESTISVFETNGIDAAVDYRYSDGRYVIDKASGNLYHLGTVRLK